MENASKALIMTGSILMAVLIIGLLVFGYKQISELEQTKSNVKESETMTEYMRKFEQFNRDKENPFYGSELLSLANLQEDYNKTQGNEELTGYKAIKINVVITKTIPEAEYFCKSTGTFSMEKILQSKKGMEAKLSEYETKDSKYKNRSVKYYATKTNKEIAEDFGIDVPYYVLDYDVPGEYFKSGNVKQLVEDIQHYRSLKSEYDEFKTGKKFYCSNVKYNKNNGRIEEMTFKEI